MRAPLLYETGANGWKVRRAGFTREIIDYFNDEGRRYFAALCREFRGVVQRLPSGTLYRERRAVA